MRKVFGNGGITWHRHYVFITHALRGQHIGLEEIDDDLWALWFGPLLLAHFDVSTLKLTEKTTGRVSPIIPV